MKTKITLLVLLFSVTLGLRLSEATICHNIGNDVWDKASNWSCGRLPQGGDTIVISVNTILQSHGGNYSIPGSAVLIHIYGTLQFKGGDKLTLPANSQIVIHQNGSLKPNGGGNTITIGTTDVFKGNDGNQNGPELINSSCPASSGGCPVPPSMLSFNASAQLKAADVSTTYGDTPFNLTATSKSDGQISYSIVSGSCAAITPTGHVTITCGGPTNTVTVKVRQQASDYYDADSVTLTISIAKAIPTLLVKNIGALQGDPSFQWTIVTNSDAAPVYTQQDGFDVANVSSSGNVTNIQNAGQTTINVLLPSTNNYQSAEATVVLTVYGEIVAPVAKDDSISTFLGEAVTLNILSNDSSYSGEINPVLTDIDLTVEGNQNKYFNPLTGTFLLDSTGELTFTPTAFFIGVTSLPYKDTDSKGTVSNTANIMISVTYPSSHALPELKATELITPNGDNLNDTFVIGYIDNLKNNTLTIYNRQGEEVYHMENYRNDWNGISKNNKRVDDGVYYYIFKENEGERFIKGTVEVKM